MTPRQIHIEEERPIIQLPERLSQETESPFGTLGNLPYDTIHHFLSRTSYSLLGRMSMTSTAWNRAIVHYVKSGSFRKRWARDVEASQDQFSKATPGSDDLFFSMGLLTKYLTINDQWTTRLSCLRTFLQTAYDIGASMTALGKMIHAFSTRPDTEINIEHIDDTVELVFSVVGSLKDELNSVVARPDEERSLENVENLHIWFYEMEVRKRVHALFLSNGSDDPSRGLNKFFLSSMLKVFKDIHTTCPTSLFFLLFAPTTIREGEEVINWHRLSQLSALEEADSQELKPLARALGALLKCRKLSFTVPWTKNCIFNLMEEITTFPTPWSMNTFVSLHILEPELVPIGVVARMNRNHEEEAGDMICTMKMLLHRWSFDVHGVMEPIIDAIKTSLRRDQCRTLFHRCWRWYHQNVDEMNDRLAEPDEILNEQESQSEVARVLAKLL